MPFRPLQPAAATGAPSAGFRVLGDPTKRPFNPLNPQSQQNLEAITKGTSQNTALNFLKATPKAAATVVVGGPAKLAASAAEGIATTVKTGGKNAASGRTYKIPGLTPFKSFQSEAGERAKAGQNPALNILQSTAEIGAAGVESVGLAKGASKLPSLLARFDVRAGGAATQKAIQAAEQDALKVAWNKIKPKLTPTEMAEAAKTEQLKTTRFGGVEQAVPTKGRSLDMTKAAAPFVEKAKNELEMVENLKRGITESATRARQGLAQSKAIWNQNELAGKINGIELPISVKSDQTLLNTFNNTKEAVLKLAKGAKKTPDGLLDVRQQLDDLMEQNFGSRIWNRQDGVSQVYKQFRNALNDLADSKVLDGALKAELRTQSLLYDAIDNVAPRIKTGSPATQFLNRHPTFKKLLPFLGVGVGGGAIGRILD